MSKPKRGLGRGLGALIPTEETSTPPAERPSDVFFAGTGDIPVVQADKAIAEIDAGLADDGLLPVPGARFAHIDPSSVVPNPRQPRAVFDEDAMAELVGSIKELGVLQPIVVRPNPAGEGYELIMGERRLRASKEAGLEAVPAIIRSTDDVDLLRDALVENLHRSQLNPLEEAAAYQQLLDDFGITHDQLATKISRSRPQISNTLRLLRLPPLVQRRVAAGVLSAGHARALLGLDDPAAMEHLAQRIVAEGLSVRATEEIVTLGVDAPTPTKRGGVRAGGRTEALDNLASRLGDRLDTRVKVQLGRTRGKVTIDFATVDDLNRIIAILDPADPGVMGTSPDAAQK
ncbi:ParB/RepB/Spo0J family partition protein [Demequina salsinemoris]|uniref:ParB/RepB/Spo0J family partition protein n=1 Tax=Demequina salsinemoris TaxID=577470 RepID=UPI0007860865|nr:ParB/RepB/Spo0J family partition protein [Demequina salsinemoris]